MPLRALDVAQVQRTQRQAIILEVFDDARQEERRLEVLRGQPQQLTDTIVILRHTAHRIRPSTYGTHLRQTLIFAQPWLLYVYVYQTLTKNDTDRPSEERSGAAVRHGNKEILCTETTVEKS